jgi:cytoskeletal protein CcmA (bactofilin family)
MAGYSRQSAAQIVNGEIVSAPPLNAEFNQVLAAFNVSTGHRHDGTANEGPLIALIADPNRHNEVLINTSLNQIDFKINVSSAAVTQFSLVDGAILPTTDDDISLGSTTAEFKDLFLDGTANIDSLIADTADINAGTIDGVTIGGNSAGAGTFTVVNASSADIDSGTIDNAVIGGTTPAAGTFTALGATNVTVTGSASSIGSVAFTSTGATVTGTLDVTGAFSASNVTVTGSASSIGSVAFTSTSATVTGNLTVSGSVTASTISAVNVSVTGSASSIGAVAFTTTSATITGNLVVSGSVTASTISAVNVTVTGSASSIGAVAFTSTSATVTGNLSVSGSITASTLSIAGNISASTISVSNITATGSASSIGAATFTSTAVTVTKLISGNVDITGGSITGVTNIFDPGSAMSYTFSGATADADPGNGNIRLNNASSTAATTIFIDNVDALSSADMTAFISLLSGGNNPSGVLGTVTLRKATFPEVFAQYSVTAVTNASGYQKLTVANKGASGAAPFTSGDSLLVDIALTGDKGDAGDGDVSGPGTATDNAVARFNGTGGSNLNNSGVIIDDSNNVTGVNALTVTTNITASNITIVGSASTIGSVAFTSTSATVTGNLTVSGSITASSLTVNGNISASSLSVSNVTVVGSASTIGAVAFTSTAATVTGNLTVTGSVTASSLTVNGNISASTITVANITATGSASTIGAVTITSTNVGIGTSSPDVEFHVQTSTDTNIAIVSGSAGTSAIDFGDGDDRNAGLIQYINADDAMTFRTSGSGEDMRIDSSGNVGINTSTPDSALHIYKQTNDRSARFQRISTQYVDIIQTASRNEIASNGKDFFISTSGANPILFRTAGTERLRIDSAGGVGINTTSITSGTALEVTGNMRITTTGNGLIFPDGSKQETAASGGTGIAIAMAIIFG